MILWLWYDNEDRVEEGEKVLGERGKENNAEGK